MTHARLTKHPADRVWAGVCAGIAHWLGVDPVLIRLAWLAWAVFGDTGSAFLAYIALMIVVPDASRPKAPKPPPAVPQAAATAPSTTATAAPMPEHVVSTQQAPPSPTADELGEVVLNLLDATVKLAATVARGAIRAVHAGFVAGRATQATPRAPRPSPSSALETSARDTSARDTSAPATASPTSPNFAQTAAQIAAPTAALHDDEPHLESDEERLQRQIRARLDQHVTDARAVIGATKVRVATHERAGRRQRLRQLAGFGVLTFGVWGLAATLNVFPHALATVSVSPMAGTAVVTAAALIGLGTYLLWTAVRRHG